MAELTISAADIEGAIEDYVSSFLRRHRARRDRHRHRRRRRHRPRRGPALGHDPGAARVPGRRARCRAEPRRAQHRRGDPGRLREDRRGPAGQAHRRGALGPGRRRLPRPRGQPARPARSTARATSTPTTRRALELQAPSVVQRQGVERAAADRHQGHRRADPDRPRPAPADHRRPQDRQDRGVRRHHPQPATELGDRRSRAAGALRVRRDRPEGHHDRQCQARARRGWRDGVHHHRRRPRVRLRRLQMACARTPVRPSASTGCTTASTS